MKYKNYIEGSRTAHIPEWIKKYAWTHDLELNMNVDKGWISKTVYFEIIAEENKINKFIKDLNLAIDDYNHRIGN